MYRPIVNLAHLQELFGQEFLPRCFSDLSHLVLPHLLSQIVHFKSWHLLYLLLEGQFHLFDSQVSPRQQQPASFRFSLLFIQ